MGARRSPAELFGAGGITVATVMSLAAVVLSTLDVVAPIGFLDRPVVSGLGVGVSVAGIALVLRAQADMGASWRIGVDPAERTELVTGGLFRWSRNPIFLGMLVFWAGIALLVPNAVAILAVVLATAAIEVQVRVVEEPYLVKTHGAEYERYAAATGRLVPGVGKLASRPRS